MSVDNPPYVEWQGWDKRGDRPGRCSHAPLPPGEWPATDPSLDAWLLERWAEAQRDEREETSA